MDKPQEIVRDGKTYTLDKNGYYRHRGQLMAGQNLGAMKVAKRKKRDKILKATPKEMRAYLNSRMQEVLDVLLDAAINDRDVAAATTLVNRCLPVLRSVEVTGENALPTLVINQLITTQSDNDMGAVIHSEDMHTVDKLPVDKSAQTQAPHPTFSAESPLAIQDVDNFCESGKLESTLSVPHGTTDDLGSGVISTTEEQSPRELQASSPALDEDDETDHVFGFMEPEP